MIDKFFEGMSSNDKIGVLLLVLFAPAVFLYMLLEFLKWLFKAKPVTIPKSDCEHEDNITGKCIRFESCKTREQCNQTVENWVTPREDG